VSDRVWTLVSNNLALWDECRRCFYLAMAAEFPRPAAPEPGAAVIQRQLLFGLRGARADKIAEGMPTALIDAGPHALHSGALAVPLPDRAYRCAISADIDVVLKVDGNAWGLVDVAIGIPNETALAAHARRLHACAQAIETPASGERTDVGALGVLAFEPRDDDGASVTGSWRWMPIARDDASFFGFLAEAISVLAQPAPPGGTALCAWCVYRDASRRTGY
jgi:hypothetical protein